jgi:hypothetical protein
VLQALTSGQEVVGDIQDVVALVMRLVPLEQVEAPVDVLDQPQLAGQEYPFAGRQRLEISKRLGDLLRSELASRVRIRGDPGVGQEFAEPIGGMGRQPLQDVFQVGERIDPVTLAASHQAIQGRRRPAASVAPDEQVVLATDGLSTQAPLRDVVVYAGLPVATGQ